MINSHSEGHRSTRVDLLKTKRGASGGVAILMGSGIISALTTGRYGVADVTEGLHMSA